MESVLRKQEHYLQILLCSLCLKTLKRPRVLPCGHTYCCSCLQSHINDKLTNRMAPGATFSCPVCRSETSTSSPTSNVDRWADSFPINKMVVSLLDKTTEADREASCDICCKRGRTTSAAAYCHECDKYLCDTCREYHDDLRTICQNSVHRLDTGIDSKSVNPNVSFVEMCPKHFEERIKYFCTDHGTLCCNMCGFLNHMKCNNINTLDGMADAFNVQMKSEKIGTYLKDLENQLKRMKTTIKQNAECIQKEKAAILHEIRTLRASLNAKLEKIENDLTHCLERMCTIEDINLELLGKKLNSLITVIESDHTQIDLVMTHGSGPQKIIFLHNLDQNLSRYFSAISEYQEDIRNVSFTFETDKIFNDFLKATHGIGMVKVTRLKSSLPPCPSRDPLSGKNAVKAYEFNIKMKDDKGICHISDILQLQDSRFLFVDNGNFKIKIYGVDFQIQDYVTFSKRPWNACTLTDTEVAVTIPKQKTIQIIRITPKIQKIREIRTRLECWGIATLREQLVITTGEDKHCIQILDRAGRESFERQIVSESEQLIKPRRLAKNVLKDMMCVSDEKGEILIAYNSSWDVQFTYKDQDIKTLSGLDTDKEGNIYLCGYSSKCVQQISGDGKLIKTIISQKLENNPLAIRFYRDINRFLLTYGNYDIVEMYDLYRMEEYCQGEISMILGSFHSGKLVFHSDGMSNCSVTIESWYSDPYIQFYFEEFDVGTDDCLTDKLMMKDGNSVYAPQITGLGSKLCGSEKPDDVYRTFTRYLRIEYETRRFFPGTPVHFSIIFNAFDVGICESWETRCDNGHCIQDEMNCNGYNPCGDNSDCKLSVGSIFGIVIGSLAGLAFFLTVIVVSICCYRRRKFRNLPPHGPGPNVATGYVISTSASQPGAIPSSYNPWYSTGHQQVLLGTAYETSPVPPMPPAQISSHPEK